MLMYINMVNGYKMCCDVPIPQHEKVLVEFELIAECVPKDEYFDVPAHILIHDPTRNYPRFIETTDGEVERLRRIKEAYNIIKAVTVEQEPDGGDE